MKNKVLPIVILTSFLLCGCNKGGDGSSSTPKQGTALIEIYSSNDMHGHVFEEGYTSGIAKAFTYFKQKKDENKNTLLIDQGDTWQGTIYSNYNHGALITDMMNYIHYDARTIGNHDFDWGVDYLKQNKVRSYDGYTTPTLAGNVYDYDFDDKIVGNVHQDDIGVKSVTYTLENGVKVGILGGIGYKQITSITSSYTKDIAFTNHVSFIKEEANHLRNDEKCDVVIASIHTGQEDLLANDLGSYVDLVLCGHTHKQEDTHEGNLYYVQNYANTGSFSHITLTYDFKAKDVTNTKLERLSGNQIKNAVSTVDPKLEEIIESYKTDYESAANEVLANNVTSSFKSSGYAENIMANAILDTTIEAGYTDVTVACINKARADLPSGSWKYSDLYEAFPFDNVIYIADVTGSEFMYQIARFGYICKNPDFTTTKIQQNQRYKVAIIDYMYFHTNEDRDYDYFSITAGTSNITLDRTYREILRDWLKANGYNNGKELDPSDYSSSQWKHKKNFSY